AAGALALRLAVGGEPRLEVLIALPVLLYGVATLILWPFSGREHAAIERLLKCRLPLGRRSTAV
ncbi:MAG TPA: hypothetical protein VEB64_15135, partial [Azospirillaceae bacterium]|nr:hypothetical protein [Azospirillaceae bacterium]